MPVALIAWGAQLSAAAPKADPEAAPSAGAQAVPSTPAARKYSLDLRETPLRQAFRTYLHGSPIGYENRGPGQEGCLVFDPNVPDPRVTVSFRDVPFKIGFFLLMGAAREQDPGISWGREGSIYVIKYSPQRGATARDAATKAIRRKSERFANLPLRGAVESWMENREGACRVAEDVPNVPVTLYLERLEVDEGLERIAEKAREKVPGLRLSRGGRHIALHL